ncbi:MAG: hypothetical protein U5R49_00185 [Deltaproteobacteria bacterium]|nr:hypothetical protein [Deltaproteobacteria bacterium]
MLYIGCFSFDGFEAKPLHGHFTCAVNADNVDASMDRFRRLLENAQKRGDTLTDVSTIYLDTVVEVKEVPSEGFLVHMISREGELTNSTSVVLPHVGDDVAQAFNMAQEETEGEDIEMEPFMSF